jgi:hypothetical protein
VDFALKKRDCIISAVKQHVIKKTHKFGTCVPGDVEDEAHALDKENGNIRGTEAITNEMKNIRTASNIKEGDEKATVRHQEIRSHGMFDVKMDAKPQDGGRWPHNGSS